MDLRERTVYLRCSSYQDLLGDHRIGQIVDSIEALTGTPFLLSRDMGSGRRQRPSRPLPGRKALDDVTRLGINTAASVMLLTTDPDAPGPSTQLTLDAGPHPYTGKYRSSLDLRVPSNRFEEPAFVEQYVDFVRGLITVARPFVGHAHDTDDTLIQNTGSAAILRRGFGLDVADDPDIKDNPGYEVSRGEFRYQAAWLMIYGPQMVEQLGDDQTLSSVTAAKVEELADQTFLLRLYDSPLEASRPENRAAQRTIRGELQLDKLAADKAWAFGFWDRRSR